MKKTVDEFEIGSQACPVLKLLTIAALSVLFATTSAVSLNDNRAFAQNSGTTAGSIQKQETSLDDKLPLERKENVAAGISTRSETGLTHSDVEKWSKQLEDLLEGLKTLDKETKDADALYLELASVLKARRRDLHRALDASSDANQMDTDLEAIRSLFAALRSLYTVRIELLRHISSELHHSVTSTGLAGMEELQGEVSQLILYFQIQSYLVPHLASEWSTQFKHAPLPLVERIVTIVLAVIVFRLWRRIAPGLLGRARRWLVNERPHRRLQRQTAKMIWYFDQTRNPLEWLTLLSVVFSAVEFDELQDLEKVLSSISQWLLLSWFSVVLINAIAARGTAGFSGKTLGLRSRSLRLIAAWIVLLGLGTDLADTYAGRGTIYAWVWFTFISLSIPMLVLLVAMWQSEVCRRLAANPDTPTWIKIAPGGRPGFKRFMSASVGSAYLIIVNLRELLIRSTSDLDWGRHFQAALYQRELSRKSIYMNNTDREPVNEMLRERLLRGCGGVCESVNREELARISKSVEQHATGVVAIISERGGGKSVFLERVAAMFEDRVTLLDCPLDGFDAFRATLSKALDIDQPKPTPGAFRHRIEEARIDVIAVDNFHRSTRPVKDGFIDMNRVSDFVRDIDARVLWIFALNQVPWQYIKRARADRMLLLEEIYLPAWTEGQISKLVDMRCNEADISPKFNGLLLPQQLDAFDIETIAERNRAGFRRLIWHAADGNPAIALRLWTNSLFVTKNGEFVVHFPEQQSTEEIERLSMTVLLVLRVIAQFDFATTEDIVESLRFSKSEVENAIIVALDKGWIEEVSGRYQVTWSWYQAITKVLTRKNLLAR